MNNENKEFEEEDIESHRDLHVFKVIEDDNVSELSKIMETCDLIYLNLKNRTKTDELLSYEPNTISVAAFNGSVNSFRYLLINGSDINEKDKKVNFLIVGLIFLI